MTFFRLSFPKRICVCSCLPLGPLRFSSASSAFSLAQRSIELAGAAVRGCVKDVSRGKTTYEVETLKDGRGKDITFDATGAVLEVEQQIDETSLPQSVAASLRKAYNGGKLGKIESLTRGGVLVSYEAVITRDGKRWEAAFRPDGAAMKAD
jgi:hypothetical protein